MRVQELFDLSGKTAIVTGGGSGLGKQMAVGLAECGANVVLCARTVERCEEVAEELRGLGARSEPEGEYDVILELVGGDNLPTNLEQLAPKGRIAVIGTGAGARAEVDFGLLMRRRGRIHGSTLVKPT